MLSKEKIAKQVQDFRILHGMDAKDEDLAVTVHLMNQHLLDRDAAMDQSSRAGGDSGVDGWFHDRGSRELIIYQSKLTENKGIVLGGLDDLQKAREWMEGVICNGGVADKPNNPCLYSLYMRLAVEHENLRKVSFVLLSLFDKNELLDQNEIQQAQRQMQKSVLFKSMVDRGGRLDLRLENYSVESGLAKEPERYSVRRFPDARVKLRENASLDLAYVSLYSLVELYRRRGDVLFHKNVRLAVTGSKETRARLVHPMEETLGKICKGELEPEIFPFFHVGVTLRATSNLPGEDEMNLEAPSVINGCQTITIATSFLTGLEKKRAADAIERFKKIQVVTKIVTGTTDDELREITNSNNRQIPIENWQLFSNEPIHIEIERALESCGVFYERQDGRFDALMRRRDIAKKFQNTNNTFVQIEELAQIVCLSRGQLQWSAKRSEIFLNKENHAKVFNLEVPKHPHDIIFLSNLFKCLKRGLQKYLEMPSYGDERSAAVFRRPVVRHHLHYVGLAYLYQHPKKEQLRRDFGNRLNKIAPNTLVDECMTVYAKIVSKTKDWYLKESKQLEVEVSATRLWEFTRELAEGIGVSIEQGAGPFSDKSIAEEDWEMEQGA